MLDRLSLPEDLPSEDAVFHCLARGLDAVPHDRQSLFLAKLALLLALRRPFNELQEAVAIAMRDL
jgi:hypothetical protein